jgi:hypothetical protein
MMLEVGFGELFTPRCGVKANSLVEVYDWEADTICFAGA